jgi:hypothetical protein
MKTIELSGTKELTYYEQTKLSGGGNDPFSHDLGYLLGKIVGWIKNSAVTNATSDDTWMLDVPPLTLFS